MGVPTGPRPACLNRTAEHLTARKRLAGWTRGPNEKSPVRYAARGPLHCATLLAQCRRRSQSRCTPLRFTTSAQ